MTMLAGRSFFLDRGCSECRGPDFAKNDAKRPGWNCDNENPAIAPSIGFAWSGKIDIRECPWSYIGGDTWIIVDAWQQWRAHGLCPFGEDNLMHCDSYMTEGILIAEDEARTIEAQQTEQQHREQTKLTKRANLGKGK